MAAWQGCSSSELKLFRRLKTPALIQDYLETLPIASADRYSSPRVVLREGRAQCLEGALLAAAILWFHGQLPLLLDLKSKKHDDDHVVALFRFGTYWGAISKTNHAVLRYREPIYRSVRELAASYFHEYFLDSGEKTLVSYSKPLNLRQYAKRGWITDEQSLNYIVAALDAQPHTNFVPRYLKLRRADTVEIRAGALVQWPRRHS